MFYTNHYFKLYDEDSQEELVYMYLIIGLGLWCLTPLSTIFQLYRGGQFYWWTKSDKFSCFRNINHFLWFI
jgi:hypothetical protein